ncbi:hypothetical protein FNF28_02662 [Cafeteria roenbergensis]|uniref:Deoxyribodipyrimidine photo-lyase n=2 Tax=Cafeteria roenbergensis TaxID=33653 RepID=A0A5A8DR60_CAFRO|nr:hypothetical protein FNF28_02662 [Cafeteria roenbergensis]
MATAGRAPKRDRSEGEAAAVAPPPKKGRAPAAAVSPRRQRALNSVPVRPGPILYWMSRDQRAEDNWALLAAQDLAQARGEPLVVAFSLVRGFLGATQRQFDWMLRGLEETEADLRAKNIPFVLVRGPCERTIQSLAARGKFGAIVCDFAPVRIGRRWRDTVASNAGVAVIEVDARNIVPAWLASDKLEYAARTIRPRIHRQLGEFLTEFPSLAKQEDFFPGGWDALQRLASEASADAASAEGTTVQGGVGASAAAASAGAGAEALPCGAGAGIPWPEVRRSLDVDATVPPVAWLAPGPAAAMAQVGRFLARIRAYGKDRNDPSKGATSLLSPYLHFGHLSSQRAALLARAQRSKAPESVDGFIEEMVVRRELAENYVFYNQDGYDRIDGMYPQFGNDSWAQRSLREHASDKRSVLYTREELESGKTHDPLWNAAQAEMVHLGHMHGFNRMYWAKKILEWTPSPEEALATCIALNDKYQLDGRDPNGWVGCAWAVAGVHDNGWKERPVFGKIRYMNLTSTIRKFSIDSYVARVAQRVEAETGLRSDVTKGMAAKQAAPGKKGQLWGLAGLRRVKAE